MSIEIIVFAVDRNKADIFFSAADCSCAQKSLNFTPANDMSSLQPSMQRNSFAGIRARQSFNVVQRELQMFFIAHNFQPPFFRIDGILSNT